MKAGFAAQGSVLNGIWSRAALGRISFALWLVAGTAAGWAGEFLVKDRFDRVLNTNGIVLVDWEGQLANPALQFFVTPPSDASFPASATLTANGARLYFDAPGTVGSSGPVKTLFFASATAVQSFRLSVFPDRDTNGENYLLTLRLGANGPTSTVPIRVLDQDRVRSQDFTVTVDFSQDRTGFYADAAKRAVARQAAEDWAYFIGDMQLVMVPAGNEQTFIWDTNAFTTGRFVANTAAYRGFLLYAYGVFTPEMRSGGEPSRHAFQRGGSGELPLRRSGGYEAEVRGNYNALGWFLTQSDDDWWVSGNLGHEPNDLYSIAHHEIGHALFFNPGYPRFAGFKQAGEVDDAQVVEYHGAPTAVNTSDHFNGAIDRLSRVGAFGYEYFGDVPRRRWLITKLDLLHAQAVGYALRPTSAFEPLALTGGALPAGVVGQSYSHRLAVAGGIPLYRFAAESGALPAGLQLDSFTGVLAGVPATTGTNEFTLRVSEYDPEAAPVSARFTLLIGEAPRLSAVAVASGQIMLSWTPATPGFVLQESLRLSPAAWTNSPSGPTNPISVSATWPTKFYRLFKP